MSSEDTSRDRQGLLSALVAIVVLVNSMVALYGMVQLSRVNDTLKRAFLSSIPERAGLVQQVVPPIGAVAIDVYSDFNCQFCRKSAVPISVVRDRFGDKVVWRYHYRVDPANDLSVNSALAALCSSPKEGPWDFYKEIATGDSLTAKAIDETLTRINRPKDQVSSCMKSDSAKQKLWRGMFESSARGITRTPTIVVDSVQLVGMVDAESLAGLIRQKLASSVKTNGAAVSPSGTD